jgi:hypothetical protein
MRGQLQQEPLTWALVVLPVVLFVVRRWLKGPSKGETRLSFDETYKQFFYKLE